MPDAVADIDKAAVYWDDDAQIWVYRAYSIYSCQKALIAARLGMEGDDPPETMQRRYDDGHLHEPSIIARIEEETGWRSIAAQETVELDVIPGEVIIRGHTDGTGQNRNFDPDQRVLEAKALADSGFKTWKSGGWEAFPYYRDQLTVYMEALELPAIFAVKNKNSGEVDITMVDTPPGDITSILDRIKVVEAKARNEDLPESCDRRMWPCPFWRLHDDEETEAVVGAVDDLRSLDEWLTAYDVARDDEKDAKERKEAAKEAIMEVLGDAAMIEGTVFRAKKQRHTTRWLDEPRMKADGVDVEEYRREKHSYFPNVERKK